ncbi:ABC transporter substrate-binding protein [Pseudorhodoferax aquiterrae]|uniref:ABC transporter substrate-binding protein n=1 Tax=Pseudorhodoferax aquiterrae TaxID=747304 RepID=A0ABQ3FZ71_9BURK|nr:tripartite tricarboxylate transporter substrate binding protein [Pseudorhodoferax aquiterrae]GHC75934.1 ABC transporter substrate-binding protein [Pseudorhodoferax aquiterrae]
MPLACFSRRAALAVASLAAAQAAVPALAQSVYPSKPITLVVPFPPGGSADTVGRLMGQQLSEALGQPVVIDNRPGAGTAIAAGMVAKAQPDGHTLLISSGSTFTANPAIRTNLPYDAVKSFDPIAVVARIPLIVLANNNVPVHNVKEFVAALRAAPDKYAYASFGSGSTAHFTGEIVLRAIGAKALHVPYKGSAPAMTDLIGGQVPFSVDTVTAALPQLKAGKVRAIAVTTAKRSSQLPEVPTFAESGYPDIDADTWIMVVAPKGLPAAVRQKLESALARSVALPSVAAQLRANGAEPLFSGSAASAALIEKELPLMRAVAQRADIKAD